MSKTRNDIRILLLQLREDKSKEHEVECFLKYGELQPSQLVSFDALTEEVHPAAADGYDALFLGGSNMCRVSHGQPNNLEAISALVRHAVERGQPVLGTCYGAHLLAHALGGKVEYRPDAKEVDTVDIHLLPAAADDLLLHDMPQTFRANCGRTDDITVLPAGAVPLAQSDLVNTHVFRIDGKPVYATQFHAELGRAEQQVRMDFAFHHTGYFDDEEHLRRAKDSVEDTPIASSVITRFVDRVVVPLVS